MQFVKLWWESVCASFGFGWIVFGAVSTAMPAIFYLLVRYWPGAANITWVKWSADHQSELHVGIAILCVIVYFIYAPYSLSIRDRSARIEAENSYKQEHAARVDAEKKLTSVPLQFQVTETDPQARAEIAALRSENKTLKVQLDEIKKSTSWGPTDEQFNVITSNLRTIASIESIPRDEQEPFISCVMGDAGSIRFAAKLASAFKAAGWKIKGVGYVQAISEPVREGVAVHVHSKTDVPRALDTLVGTLKRFGIECTGYVREQLPPGHFDIDVGLKPELSMPPPPNPDTEASPH